MGPNILSGKEEFVLKPALITMVQASPFHGKPSEDANANLQNFLEICNTISIKESHKTQFDSDFFLSHCTKRRSIGFIPTRDP